MTHYRAAAIAAILAFLAPAANATTVLSFAAVTDNDPAAVATAGQYSVAVSAVEGNPNQVAFQFFNDGSSNATASITGIYFDDGTLLGIAQVINGTGVVFSQGASPRDLPGGNQAAPPFEVTAGFAADSDSPTSPNGVNAGETVTIIFNLQSGGTIAEVLSELATGELRIGIHVQSLPPGDDGSESFINTPLVPEPGLLAMAGIGALALLRTTRRRDR